MRFVHFSVKASGARQPLRHALIVTILGIMSVEFLTLMFGCSRLDYCINETNHIDVITGHDWWLGYPVFPWDWKLFSPDDEELVREGKAPKGYERVDIKKYCPAELRQYIDQQSNRVWLKRSQDDNTVEGEYHLKIPDSALRQGTKIQKFLSVSGIYEDSEIPAHPSNIEIENGVADITINVRHFHIRQEYLLQQLVSF